jgi:hypothetical protein
METTDTQQRPIIETIGKDVEEPVALLTPWRDTSMARHGYPGQAFVEQQGERATWA